MNLQWRSAKCFWNARLDHLIFLRPLLVATLEYVCRCIRLQIANSRQAVLRYVWLAWHALGPQLVRLENRSELVILDLADGIEFVIVAPAAIHRRAEKCFLRGLDRCLQPRV